MDNDTMPKPSDDAYKEIMEMIHKIITDQIITNNDKSASVFGLNVSLNENGIQMTPIVPLNRYKTPVVDVFDEMDKIIIQTELPKECQDDFFLEYQSGNLVLSMGLNRESTVKIPIQDIDQSKTETHLNNGILEIICFKKDVNDNTQKLIE